MQDYIEEHITETVTLSDLAEASLYSPWHSYRLFVKWLNMTPSEYIRRLRLSKSAMMLRDSKSRIIEAALDAGYGSVDGYQRAFSREFGCNPGDYAMHPEPLYLFRPYGIQYKEIRKENVVEKVKTVFVQLVKKPERSVMIKRAQKANDYWTYCAEVGCEVWGLLSSVKSLSGEPICLWLPKEHIRPGTSEYVQGVELPLVYEGQIPKGFEIINLPECEYLMFKGEPFAEEDFREAITQLRQAIVSYDPSLAGYAWDDSNPRIQLEPLGTRGYIELLAVKPL